MPKVESKLVTSPYTGKEETIYLIYLNNDEFVASTYDREEAYGKYYNRALRNEEIAKKKEEAAKEIARKEEAKTTADNKEKSESDNKPVEKDLSWVISQLNDLDYQITVLHRHNLTIENNSIDELQEVLLQLSADNKISNDDLIKYLSELSNLSNIQERNYKNQQRPQPEEKKNEYFNQEQLETAIKKAYGESGQKQLESVVINPGKAFLEGKVTNINCDPSVKDENIPDEIKKKPITFDFDILSKEQIAKTNDGISKLSIDGSDLLKLSESMQQQTLDEYNTRKQLDEDAKNTLLQGNLTKVSMNDLLSITNDGGVGLLSSKLTQATQNLTQLDQVKTLTNMSSYMTGAFGMASSIIGTTMNSPEIIMTLSTAIISEVTEIVTKETTQLAMDYLMKHQKYMMSFPKQITSYAMSYFNDNKMCIGNILKLLTQSAEGRQAKKKEENNEKSKSNFMSKMNEKSKKFIDKMNNYVKIGTSYIGMVTSYIQNGPEWVTNEIDKQIDKLMEGAKKEVNDQWQKDKETYDNKAKLLGDKLGQEMVEKYNNALIAAQKKLAEKTETTKRKAKSKLTASTAKAASKLGAMLGMYIPTPDVV